MNNIIKTPTKSLLSVFISVLVFVTLLFLIAINSFKNGKFTCNKYILNTYLYVIITFNIIAILCLSLEHHKIQFQFTLMQFLGIFLITLGLIISLGFINPKYIVGKHFVWLLFILALGMIFYPMYNSFEEKSVVLSAILTTVMLTVFLSVVAFIKPELISFSLGPILLMILIAVIIMELSMLIIYRKDYTKIRGFYRGFSYFVIFLFMGFILFDTKMLQVRAKACVNADYIQESLHLFLDIFNIFVRVLGLSR
jgi:FtsH-binding integral membrane protein